MTGQDRTGQDKTRQDKTRQDKTGQDKTGQDKAGQGRTRQDKTGQDKTEDDISLMPPVHCTVYSTGYQRTVCDLQMSSVIIFLLSMSMSLPGVATRM